jgi:hypothetical protein
MATILAFDPSESRRTNRSNGAGKAAEGSARIIIFTGVRREKLGTDTTVGAAGHPEPMFDDPLPAKPRGRKPRRQKNG